MRLRRSIIWANGIDVEAAEKKTKGCADAICFDLEDGVTFAKKPQAREKTVEMLKTWDFLKKEKIVRINPVDSKEFAIDMTKVIAVVLPDAVRVPKCEYVKDVLKIDAMLSAIEVSAQLPENTIEIIAMIESPMGVRNAFEIATCCKRLTALNIGMEDLTREMGVERRYADNSLDLIYARQKLVLDAKAAGVQAIDSVLLLRDKSDKANQQQNLDSKQTGFEGRSVSNNEQARWANETFAPDPSKVAWAMGAIKAYDEKDGEGEVIYQGYEICYAAYEKAKALIAKAELIRDSKF